MEGADSDMNEENGKTEQRADAVSEAAMTAEELLFDAENRDWALQMFVGMCNISGIEISITLNLNGCYVSGHIVRPEVYFEGLRSDLQSATFSGNAPGEVKKMMEDVLSRMKEMVAPLPGEDVPGKDNADPRGLRPRYIHLRGARFFAPNDPGHPVPSFAGGVWWKGKISSVDGFYFGMPFPT
jgi:hypothetical protein